MDLPTCPACKQSVLDEDVAECPFCGASMKGGAAPPRTGTATAPAKAAPARSAPPKGAASPRPESTRTASAASAPTSAHGETPKSAAPADDDPFAVDPSVAAKATPVSRTTSPGKTLEIKCPMCETTGYVAHKVAGHQVKCCNPKCLVPIFTAPAPKKVEAPPPPPAKKKSAAALYAGIIGLVVIAGGVTIWQMSGPPPHPAGNSSIAPMGGNASGTGGAASFNGTTTGNPETADAGGTDAKAVAPKVEVDPKVELTRQALKKLVDAAFNAPPIRKAYCRRLAATAYIAAGDLAEGRAQLDQLQKIGAQTPYEGCLPVVLMAWTQIASNPDGFAKSVAEAKRLADKLPPRGRYSVEAGIGTAAVLAASGKMDEARQMIAAHQGPPDLKQFAAALQVVQHQGTFDLDAPLIGRSVGEWEAPLETAVALILAARGRWDDAQTWAGESVDPAAKAEATLAWAEAFSHAAVATDPAADLARAEAAADSLPAAVKARLWARLAAVRLAAGNRSAAEELLQNADSLFQTIAPPPAVKIQGIKPLLDWKAPDVLALRHAAMAAADIGIVQYQLQQVEPAWNSFQKSLKFLRGTAPALNFIAGRRAQLEGIGTDSIRAELKAALQLRTDDQIRRAVLQYRQKADEIKRASEHRFLCQTDVLETAARLGLADQVWNEVELSQKRPDADEREPFLASGVPIVVALQYTALGKDDRHEAVMAAASDQLEVAGPEMIPRIRRALTQNAVDTGDAVAAVEMIKEVLNDSGTLHEWALRLACRLVKAGEMTQAAEFLGKLRDPGLREDGLALVAALAARTGHSAEAWKIASSKLSVSETAATCAGLVVGLSRGNAAVPK
ncbi:MAG: hypothetical protein EXS05_04020 [Planctomycetaceae bacterium]|nr:hypothetical protein [Planctomycetaceae bacterium]